jgi:hypothetical protein
MNFRRSRMISLRVTESEYADLSARAARKGLSLSDFVRGEVRQADLARGVVDFRAYGPPSRTLPSGGWAEYRNGEFVHGVAA